MANISHSTLTGAQLHEPKAIDSAATGTVYVANGSGSGTWQSVGTSAFTGMIADFVAPVAPAGWLELDGSTISTSTYSSLYGVMAIQTSGTRNNGSATITSIPDTSTFKVGYFVFGTGITSGTTILNIDSANQITLSATATSSGSSTIAISPWLLNTGTIKLPDTKTSGHYRRSRTATTAVGQVQSSQNLAHTHGSPITSGIQSANHTHTYSGNTGTESAAHTHNATAALTTGVTSDITPGSVVGAGNTTITTGTESATHTHAYSGTTANQSIDHTHSVTIASDGGTEARPITLIVLTCVKT